LFHFWGNATGSKAPSAAPTANTPQKTATKPDRPPIAAEKPLPDRKLPGGTIIKSSGLNGKCGLQIENGNDKDAAVKLLKTSDNKCVVYFYVSAASTHSVETIPDGSYRLLFMAGRDWDEKNQSFTRDKAFSEFNGHLSFETVKEKRSDGTYVNHRGHRVTLHRVAHGNAPTHGISESEFLSE
jgi:hypothetical protein